MINSPYQTAEFRDTGRLFTAGVKEEWSETGHPHDRTGVRDRIPTLQDRGQRQDSGQRQDTTLNIGQITHSQVPAVQVPAFHPSIRGMAFHPSIRGRGSRTSVSSRLVSIGSSGLASPATQRDSTNKQNKTIPNNKSYFENGRKTY